MLDTLILDLAAFSGMQVENMTHGHGWRFLEIGRRVERTVIVLVLAGASARIAGSDDSVLTPLLEICDSSMTYRRLHFARPRLVPVVDLLLLNDANPRSVAYQIEALNSHSQQLPVDPQSGHAGREKRMAADLRGTLAALDLDSFAQRESAAFSEVPAFCTGLLAETETFSDLLTEHYFSHAARRVR